MDISPDKTPETRQPEEVPAPPPKEYRAAAILLTLFAIQGTAFSFYLRSVSLLFLDRGATADQLGLISLVMYPLSFKFLFAPFMNVYYSEKWGKRKSYVLPAQYAFAILQFIVSFFINSAIDNGRYGVMTVVGFISIMTIIIQDVAVDGWALSLLHKDNRSFAAAAVDIGRWLGNLSGYAIFIYLNSKDVCQTYFGLSEPLVTPKSFVRILGLVTLAVTLVIQFYVEEKPVPASEQQVSIQQTFKYYKGFWYNKNVLGLICFFCIYRGGYLPISDGSSIILRQKEIITKEQFSTIDTVCIFVFIAASFVAAKYVQGKSPFTVIFKLNMLRVISCALVYIIVAQGSSEYATLTFYLYLISQICDNSIHATFLAVTSTVPWTSEVKISGIYMTTMYSLNNFGSVFSKSISLFLLKHIDYLILAPIGLLFVFLFFNFIAKPKLLEWAELPHEAWAITPYSEGPIEEAKSLVKEMDKEDEMML